MGGTGSGLSAAPSLHDPKVAASGPIELGDALKPHQRIVPDCPSVLSVGSSEIGPLIVHHYQGGKTTCAYPGVSQVQDAPGGAWTTECFDGFGMPAECSPLDVSACDGMTDEACSGMCMDLQSQADDLADQGRSGDSLVKSIVDKSCPASVMDTAPDAYDQCVDYTKKSIDECGIFTDL